MGMAASQARFLGLTARKTNTEYEGQQINQQRTTLSNQTANYYNQLLGMTVPVPPSSADYTKTVYTFEDGALSNSISSMIAQADGNYLISYTSSWTNDFAVVTSYPAVYTRNNTGTEDAPNYEYYVGAVKLRDLGEDLTFTAQEYDENGDPVGTGVSKLYYDQETKKYYRNYDEENGYTNEYTPTSADNTVKYTLDFEDEYLKTLSADQIANLKAEEERYISQLEQKYGEGNWMVRYVQNTTTKTWSPYFVNKDVLEAENTVYNENGISQSNIQTYTVGAAQETEEVKGVTAKLEQDATGRVISITLNPDDPATKVTYAVKTNTVTDQAALDDAMNQYEYDKYEYDQSIQNINAKIEIIQAEDKNLELRLKQLDTEQDAIQTEMDAVQKVIEKNTESTFKTFG